MYNIVDLLILLNATNSVTLTSSNFQGKEVSDKIYLFY